MYQSKVITKKYTTALLNQHKHKLDTTFMSSENSRTSKPHVLLLNFTDKIDLQRGKKKHCFYEILVFIVHGKT